MGHRNKHAQSWGNAKDGKLEHHGDIHYRDCKEPLRGDRNIERNEVAIANTNSIPSEKWGLKKAILLSLSWKIWKLLGEK